MKKAIVFGANGYLARNLIFYLLKKDFILELYDLQNESKDGYSFYENLNIINNDELQKIDFNVDFVFIFSAITGTKNGFDNYEDFITTNEIGTLNIINTIKKNKSNARIIFPSTRLVYKGISNTLLKEDSIQETKTIYSANKIFCENILQLYANLFGINYTIFRICVPYNNIVDTNYSYGTIGSFITRASKGENITLYGDGNLKRTFTNVKDFVDIVYQSIINPNTNNSIFNIGGETFSLKEVASKIALIYNIEVEHIEWPKLDFLIESGDTIFDSSKLDKLLNYKYSNKLNDWLAEINKKELY
ncbi:MAG: NAD(P)-dependent oxidoreductase [Bacteroidota bacterium]